MLERLTIDNVVLIKKEQIEFSQGLISVTGETGAGKSVLIDSIALALGQRANAGVIRHGEESATIQADFYFKENHPSFKLIESLGIEIEENEFSIRRKITADGRSNIFINGSKVTQSQVKDIATYLVDMHSQYDNQVLLDNKNHIELLDTFAKLDKTALIKAYEDYKVKKKSLKEFEEKAEYHERELTLQKAYLEELELLDIQKNEVDHLTQERSMLMNAEKVIGNIENANNILSEDLSSKINSATQFLSEASVNLPEEKKAELDELVGRLSSVAIELEDATNEVEFIANSFEASPERLEEVDERLFAIKDCARKHSVGPEELLELLEKIRLEVEYLENYEQSMGSLAEELENAKKEFIKQAEKAAAQRLKVAKNLEQEVESVLKSLHMKNVKFKVFLTDLEFEKWHINGSQDVEFFVSTNLGQALSALAKVASGGEVARLMLALKVVFFKNMPAQTLVFDEIDTGVGGQVADAVGECIKELSSHHQVIVISHQAQVASKANQHLKVEKSVVGDSTISNIRQLEHNEIIDELARMISGKEITTESKQLAKTMIN